MARKKYLLGPRADLHKRRKIQSFQLKNSAWNRDLNCRKITIWLNTKISENDLNEIRAKKN
jgi:uncharacterized membrane protein YdbT with pleckstrin-like domain